MAVARKVKKTVEVVQAYTLELTPQRFIWVP